MPSSSQEDPTGFLYRIRVRNIDESWVRDLTQIKLRDNAPGSYPPLFLFHPSISRHEELSHLVSKMQKNLEVDEEDKLYILAGNHNYLSNVRAIQTIDALKAGNYKEDIKIFQNLLASVFVNPRVNQNEKINLLTAVSFTNLLTVSLTFSTYNSNQYTFLHTDFHQAQRGFEHLV